MRCGPPRARAMQRDRFEAQRRRLVMSGAEGEARLDADRNDAVRHAPGIVRAIEKEPPGPHRRQAELALANPILIGQGLDADALADEPAQQVRIRLLRR